MFGPNCPDSFIHCFFIGSYVKTMSTDDSHLGLTLGPMDTIHKRDTEGPFHKHLVPNGHAVSEEEISHCFSHRVLC